MTAREMTEKLYREGKLLNLATRRPLTQEGIGRACAVCSATK